MTAKLEYGYGIRGSSKTLDKNWRSAIEPISLGNNQQKQENK